MHSQVDSRIEDDVGEYVITILDLATGDTQSLNHRYQPISIDQVYEPLSITPEFEARNPRAAARLKEQGSYVQGVMAERKYVAPISQLLSDGELIFAVGTPRRDSTSVRLDVFDAVSASFITTAILPILPTYITHDFIYSIGDYQTTGAPPDIKVYSLTWHTPVP